MHSLYISLLQNQSDITWMLQKYARLHSHLLMKTLGFMRSPGPILIPRVSPIVRTFHSGFNGMLQSCQFGLEGQPMHPITSPTILQLPEREREKWICQDCSCGWWIIFEICRQFTWVRCIWLLLCSSVFHSVLCMFVARHISVDLS